MAIINNCKLRLIHLRDGILGAVINGEAYYRK